MARPPCLIVGGPACLDFIVDKVSNVIGYPAAVKAAAAADRVNSECTVISIMVFLLRSWHLKDERAPPVSRGALSSSAFHEA
jgi:hypothetical protein